MYHIDNQTWGKERGPDLASAWQGVFTYPSFEDQRTHGAAMANNGFNMHGPPILK